MSTTRLLVCDDDRSNSHLVSRCLRAEGYEVDVAGNGEEALKLVERNHYALAVLDYQMPGMDGVELYHHIRELSPSTVGIFLTAFTTLDIVYPAIKAGVESVLAKPVELNELRALVEAKIGKPTTQGAKSDGKKADSSLMRMMDAYLPPSSRRQA